MAQDDSQPEGWAGFAAPDTGTALLVPLSPAILKAGAPLAETAKQRALDRYGDLTVAQDILAGNAWFALHDSAKPRGTVAACLGGLARLAQSRCLVAHAVRRGNALDCVVERLDPVTGDDALRAARKRLAELTGLPARAIVPGRIAGKNTGDGGQASDGS